MKLKPLPSLKEGKRYIVFRILSDRPEYPLEFQAVRDAILNSILNWLGEETSARAGVWVIRNLWDRKGQRGFIRCSRRETDLVKTALAMVHQIGDQRVIIHTVKVAGTIRKGKSGGVKQFKPPAINFIEV
jgi:RNase P/RNase MRP subunit POP5